MSLPLIFSFLCLLIGASTADNTPIFSLNTSRVEVGQSFTAKCQVTTPSEAYVFIERDDLFLIRYDIPAASPGQPQITLYQNDFTDITILPVFANSTHFQVSLTPKTTDAHTYYCYDSGNRLYSPKIAITVVSQLPSPAFSVNISKPQVGVPFVVTCTITQFSPTVSSNYSVAFYSKRDGLLAAYETENNNALLSIREHAHLSISDGTRATFPVFDLTLTEAQDLKQEYWCTFNETMYGTLESSHWGADPFISFASTKGNAPNTRLGDCSLENFTPVAGQPYSVQFFTTQGPASVNLLASFLNRPNKIPEFISKEVTGWSEITHGANHAFPNFSIQATGSSTLSGTWWCLLALGTAGSGDYHEYSSVKVNLA